MEQPKSLYEKILRAEKATTIQEIIDKENSKRIRVHMPCKVVRVNKNSVDVEIQGSEDSGFGYYVKFPQLLDLPIIYTNYTSKAFIITPIQVGDTGLVEFLDFNSSNFNEDGNTVVSSDQYPHSLNNGVFINGFIPNQTVEVDMASDEAIVIGLHNKTLRISANTTGELTIKTDSEILIDSKIGVTINSPKVDFTGSINVGVGANGCFTSSDGKTITLVNGIITDIK